MLNQQDGLEWPRRQEFGARTTESPSLVNFLPGQIGLRQPLMDDSMNEAARAKTVLAVKHQTNQNDAISGGNDGIFGKTSGKDQGLEKEIDINGMKMKVRVNSRGEIEVAVNGQERGSEIFNHLMTEAMNMKNSIARSERQGEWLRRHACISSIILLWTEMNENLNRKKVI
ncbi:unnamed protein product [Protopolystoma xenopodis]|uniref:Uncharacterized protein n=1 Tax=Protopolystoma xenopodis TaxID=117903 RepID=A0A3S5AAE1_9PLAT|nr:unnamed protein product [Protopolystoma xenopodis]